MVEAGNKTRTESVKASLTQLPAAYPLHASDSGQTEIDQRPPLGLVNAGVHKAPRHLVLAVGSTGTTRSNSHSLPSAKEAAKPLRSRSSCRRRGKQQSDRILIDCKINRQYGFMHSTLEECTTAYPNTKKQLETALLIGTANKPVEPFFASS
nr:hypothetical protein Iba_chr10dCG14330 [Ipomoea batatas]